MGGGGFFEGGGGWGEYDYWAECVVTPVDVNKVGVEDV